MYSVHGRYLVSASSVGSRAPIRSQTCASPRYMSYSSPPPTPKLRPRRTLPILMVNGPSRPVKSSLASFAPNSFLRLPTSLHQTASHLTEGRGNATLRSLVLTSQGCKLRALRIPTCQTNLAVATLLSALSCVPLVRYNDLSCTIIGFDVG